MDADSAYIEVWIYIASRTPKIGIARKESARTVTRMVKPAKVYASEHLTVNDAERLIREEYGDVALTRKDYLQLILWFIGEPDANFQNYIAEMGANALVIAAKAG